jgi:hypothetical protein
MACLPGRNGCGRREDEGERAPGSGKGEGGGRLSPGGAGSGGIPKEAPVFPRTARVRSLVVEAARETDDKASQAEVVTGRSLAGTPAPVLAEASDAERAPMTRHAERARFKRSRGKEGRDGFEMQSMVLHRERRVLTDVSAGPAGHPPTRSRRTLLKARPEEGLCPGCQKRIGRRDRAWAGRAAFEVRRERSGDVSGSGDCKRRRPVAGWPGDLSRSPGNVLRRVMAAPGNI